MRQAGVSLFSIPQTPGGRISISIPQTPGGRISISIPQTPGGRIRALGFARLRSRGRGRGPVSIPRTPGGRIRVPSRSLRRRAGASAPLASLDFARGAAALSRSLGRRAGAARPESEHGLRRPSSHAYSIFCTCSRSCSMVALRSRPTFVSATSPAFEQMVLASRFSSWHRKSSRRPMAPPSASRSRTEPR